MVSIIITTCKRNPKVLKRAIDSIVNQTYSEWELIIVDDSPDEYEYRNDVEECVCKYTPLYKVYFIKNKKNMGACYSRNKGLELAKGEYVAFLDDDDEWLSNKLEKQISIFHEAPENVALVYGPYYIINDSTNERKMEPVTERNGGLYEDLMRYGNFVGGMSMPMMKTACVRKVGGFDEKMQSAQDMDLWLRLAKQYEMRFCATPLVLYHIHGGEQISSNPRKKIEGIKRLREKNIDYINCHKKSDARLKRTLSINYAASGEKKEALSLWIDVIRLSPFELIPNMKTLMRILHKADV